MYTEHLWGNVSENFPWETKNYIKVDLRMIGFEYGSLLNIKIMLKQSLFLKLVSTID